MEKALYFGSEVEVLERGYGFSKIKNRFGEIRSVLSKDLQKPKAPRPAASALQERNMTWTPELSAFILALARSPRTHLYLESTTAFSKRVEDKYFSLTDEVIVPTPGAYNIAPEGKWSTEGTITFDPAIQVPDSLGVVPEKDGTLGSVELFWALIRIGFRVGYNHDVAKVLKSVPAQFAVAS